MKYKKGDVLVSIKCEDTVRIGAICGELYLLISTKTENFYGMSTEKQLDERDYTLEQEGPWVPEIGQRYFYVDNALGGQIRPRTNEGREMDIWLQNSGNCHQTEEQAKKYKAWLLTKPYKN